MSARMLITDSEDFPDWDASLVRVEQKKKVAELKKILQL